MPRQDVHFGKLHREAGAGRPVVLLHGWSLSSAVFADELAGLASTGRRAIAPDLRGHGRSPAPQGPFGLADLARDVAALFDALSLERAVLLGWSLGAQVALAAAPLLRARLSALVEDRLVEWHRDARAVLPSLKEIGASTAVPGRSGLGGRAATLEMLHRYDAAHRTPRGVPATYHVLFALADR